MSFITQVTISIVIYFITRISLKGKNSLNIASVIAALSYAVIYLYAYDFINILPTIHFMVTGFSLIFIFISYNEIIILERKVRKIKKGELVSNEPFQLKKVTRLYLNFLVLDWFVYLWLLFQALVCSLYLPQTLSSNLFSL